MATVYIQEHSNKNLHLSFSMVCVDMCLLYTRKISLIGAPCRFHAVERQDVALVYSTCFFLTIVSGIVKVIIDGKQHGD